MTQSSNRTILDYAQVPLALGSFAFFRLVRLVLRGFVALTNRSRRGKPGTWRIVSGDLVGKPLALPIFMTKAPRWNPHAVIGMAGPLAVRSSITVDTAQAGESAETWGLAIQPMGHGREVRLPSAGERGAPRATLQLPAGDYMLVMRYYGPRGRASFPAIQVDGRDQVAARAFDADNNRFYASLPERSGWLYAWLGYYVYTMLRFADWLPASFVTKEFLPAGDPEMQYEFGAVRRGTALRISMRPEVLSSYAVYFTRYNRASFPLLWQEIDNPECTIPGAGDDGYYLIRLLLRKGRPELSTRELLTVSDIVAPRIAGSPA